MAKIVHESIITGAKGVNAFERYCLSHQPILVWREETKHDFGIDGEVEFTGKTKNGKTAVTGNIVKVQLKSTKYGGYIQKENDNSFEFIAKQKDIEYWSEHSCDVILVVFFEETEELYARKISREDLNLARKTQPLLFSKNDNRLSLGDGKFRDRYSFMVFNRVSFNHTERLFSNPVRRGLLETSMHYPAVLDRMPFPSTVQMNGGQPYGPSGRPPNNGSISRRHRPTGIVANLLRIAYL